MSKLSLNTPAFICLIGIDGSGKTTLAKKLIDSLSSKGLKYHYFWGGIDRLILMSPLRAVLYKRFLSESSNNNVEDQGIETMKNNLRSKYPKLIRVYYLFMKIDYILWLFAKMMYFKIRRKHLICDRYIFDVSINMAIVQNMSESSIYSFINKGFKFLPKPDILLWLDVPVKTALDRKKDIYTKEHLLQRRKIYEELAKRYSAIRLDGTKSIHNVKSKALDYLLSWNE